MCGIGVREINFQNGGRKMRQMKKKILMIFAILLVFACQVSARGVGINSVDIIPNQPLNTDLITFNISGSASADPSWVTSDLFSQNGTSLQLDLYVDMGFRTAISYWNYSKQIQPLTPATYNLEVRALDGNQGSPFYGTVQDTYNVNFTVVPEPCTVVLLGFGIILARKKLVR